MPLTSYTQRGVSPRLYSLASSPRLIRLADGGEVSLRPRFGSLDQPASQRAFLHD